MVIYPPSDCSRLYRRAGYCVMKIMSTQNQLASSELVLCQVVGCHLQSSDRLEVAPQNGCNMSSLSMVDEGDAA